MSLITLPGHHPPVRMLVNESGQPPTLDETPGASHEQQAIVWDNANGAYRHGRTVVFAASSTAPSAGVVTVDFTASQKHHVSLTANVTSWTITDPPGACSLIVKLTQDATGGRTVAFPAWKWAGGSAPTVPSAANAVTIVSLYYDGSTYYAQGGSQAYS